MGALWQYRWLVLVLLIAPTIAYCQYRAVERLATERCVNAGGTWDEESDECTGLPAPQATESEESEAADEATGRDDAAEFEPEYGTGEARIDEPAAERTN